jgi:hypothetical protein
MVALARAAVTRDGPARPRRHAACRRWRLDVRRGKVVARPLDCGLEMMMSIPSKAIVISNCQCLPLACALTVMSTDTVFDFWSVHLPAPDARARTIAEFVAKTRQDYDLIVSIPLSNDYLDLSSARLRETFDGIPVVTISNIYFAGLHPDLCYIAGPGDRIVQGPLGDYHSRLALYAFLKGMSETEAASLFRNDVYERLGFYNVYATSLNELIRRDAGIDVPVTALLPGILRRFLAFYSVNHPTSAVFVHYARQIVDYLAGKGLGHASGLPLSPMFNEGSLAHSAIFPIYPEIARRHGIPMFGSYTFKPPGDRRNPLQLERFLQREYAALRDVEPVALRTMPISREIIRFFDRQLSA